MTVRAGAMSIDGSPISAADRARMASEEATLKARQLKAVRVIAAQAQDVADCRLLLDVLGLDPSVVAEARAAGGTKSAKVEAGTPSATSESAKPAAKTAGAKPAAKSKSESESESASKSASASATKSEDAKPSTRRRVRAA